MARNDNPSVNRQCPLSGDVGEAPGHIHWADHGNGVIGYQCSVCGLKHEHTHAAIKDAHGRHAATFGDTSVVALPPCPGCGALPFLAHNDVEHGQELPHRFTNQTTRELVQRLQLQTTLDRRGPDSKYEGRDFSHLPGPQRPPQHKPINEARLKAEFERGRRPVEP
jgi:hypothetical protein